jgi:uncharacterized protein YjiS (DUF1127 family)
MASHETKTSGYPSLGAITAKAAGGAAMPVGSLPSLRRGQNWLVCLSVVRLVEVLLDWRDRARQRRRLAMLDHYMLRDIGLSPADVEHEVDKPFWRA